MVANAQTIPYRRVYVWELPVRIYHWLNALCIVILFATGYVIGNPQAVFNANEAYQLYWFGWVRFTHFVVSYVLLFNFTFRIYWGFVGNRYARWDRFVAYRPQQWKDLWETIKVDIVQAKLHGDRAVIGHNMLAGVSYFFLFNITLIQVFTGFALYSSMSSSWFPNLFSWAVPLMGGDAYVRMWHHIFSWFFVLFTMVHVYLVFYHDYFEGRGTTSSIIGGWKFERDDKLAGRS